MGSQSRSPNFPKDAQVIMSILKDMGVADYEQRVLNQLLEFTYSKYTTVPLSAFNIELSRYITSKVFVVIGLTTFIVFFFLYAFHYLQWNFAGYVTCILDDSRAYATHAKKKTIDLEDVKLAVNMQLDRSFTTPPPREVRFIWDANLPRGKSEWYCSNML